MQVELNLKTLGIVLGLLSALIGNVFVAGKIWSDQQLHMEKMSKLEKKVDDISNLYDVKASILNLENKIIQLEFFLGMIDQSSCDNPANAGRIDCK